MSVHIHYRNLVAGMLVFLLTATLLAGVVAAQTVNGFNVIYGGRIYDGAANRTTFTYLVSGTGTPPDLSHFDLEIPTCPTALVVVTSEPSEAVSFGVDPTTGINGIKWDLPLQSTATRVYSITFEGNVLEGNVLAAVKGGDGFATTTVPGPSCAVPQVDVEKYISTDGVTWQDADGAPGPFVLSGTQVSYRFVVTNTGNVELTTITLSDDIIDLSSCTLPATLPADAFFECIVGPIATADGQHVNTATVSGIYNSFAVSDTDSAYFFAGLSTPTMTPTPESTAEPTSTVTSTPISGNLPITIVIEGPVQAINVNIITIYDIDIQIDDDDSNLSIIQIGDIVRVGGNTQTTNGTIIIVAVNIVILNVEINEDTGEYWRDDGNCSNPPPPWAPAHGWRRQCEGRDNSGSHSGSRGSRS